MVPEKTLGMYMFELIIYDNGEKISTLLHCYQFV